MELNFADGRMRHWETRMKGEIMRVLDTLEEI